MFADAVTAGGGWTTRFGEPNPKQAHRSLNKGGGRVTKRITFSGPKARLINGCPYVSHSGPAASLKCGLPYSRKPSYAALRVSFWADRRPGCARRGGFSSCAAGTLRTVDRRSLLEKTSPVRLGHRLLCPVLAATARWQTCCGSKPFNIPAPNLGSSSAATVSSSATISAFKPPRQRTAMWSWASRARSRSMS